MDSRSDKTPAPTKAAPSSDDPTLPRLYWIPEGVSIDDWPPGLQAAVAGVINPAYEQLVMAAAPGLAQSTGVTVVHLLWLEVLDQVELSRQTMPSAPAVANPDRSITIERHLRLVNAKLKASELLQRLEALRERRIEME
jgi:hypothetical protein